MSLPDVTLSRGEYARLRNENEMLKTTNAELVAALEAIRLEATCPHVDALPIARMAEMAIEIGQQTPGEAEGDSDDIPGVGG